jgi:hypothetical protein
MRMAFRILALILLLTSSIVAWAQPDQPAQALPWSALCG